VNGASQRKRKRHSTVVKEWGEKNSWKSAQQREMPRLNEGGNQKTIIISKRIAEK
jgi:hypothetical protein